MGSHRGLATPSPDMGAGKSNFFFFFFFIVRAMSKFQLS